MAAAKKSTLNSKLGRVSKIRFCTAAGKNMTTRIYTAESSAFSVKVGCKQPTKKSDPYQIQYRMRSRYTAANAKKKGADWTKWSGWRNMVAFGSGSSAVALGSAKNPDTWLKSNKGVNKKSSYMTFYEFKGTKVNGAYDARQYQVRIRTYNAKTRKHGAWVTQTLSVYKRAVVEDETIHRGVEGQLILDCNYIWDRGGTVLVESIKDSTGRELLNCVNELPMDRDSLRQKTVGAVPPYRKGYVPGEFFFDVERDAGLKRGIRYGEKLTWRAWYVTSDGAKTRLKSTIRVESQDTSTISRPRMTAQHDQAHGWMVIRGYKGADSDEIMKASVTCTYVYRGKTYTVKPSATTLNTSASDTETAFGKWTFKELPLNVALTFKLTVGNDYQASRAVKATAKMPCRWWLLGKATGGSDDFAALQFNRELTITSTPKVSTGLPHGRGKPFAAYMKGDETTITLSGVVADKPGAKWHKYATLHYIDKLRGNQGVYVLRGPHNGEMYRVALTSVSRHSKYPDESLYEVTIQMTEVA